MNAHDEARMDWEGGVVPPEPETPADDREFTDRMLEESNKVRPNVNYIMQELERCFPKLRTFMWSSDRAFINFREKVERAVLSARMEAVLESTKGELKVMKTIAAFTKAVADAAAAKALAKKENQS